MRKLHITLLAVLILGATASAWTGYWYLNPDGTMTPMMDIKLNGKTITGISANADSLVDIPGFLYYYNTHPLNYCTEIGADNLTSDNATEAVVVGKNNSIQLATPGDGGVAMGYGNTAGGQGSVAIGWGCTAKEYDAPAIGSRCMSDSIDAPAIGSNCKTSAPYASAIGSWCNAEGPYSTALAYFSVSMDTGAVDINCDERQRDTNALKRSFRVRAPNGVVVVGDSFNITQGFTPGTAVNDTDDFENAFVYWAGGTAFTNSTAYSGTYCDSIDAIADSLYYQTTITSDGFDTLYLALSTTDDVLQYTLVDVNFNGMVLDSTTLYGYYGSWTPYAVPIPAGTGVLSIRKHDWGAEPIGSALVDLAIYSHMERVYPAVNTPQHRYSIKTLAVGGGTEIKKSIIGIATFTAEQRKAYYYPGLTEYCVMTGQADSTMAEALKSPGSSDYIGCFCKADSAVVYSTATISGKFNYRIDCP